MPKLDGMHILSRLSQRLEQLQAGEEIAAKEIRSLLTPEQQQELEDAWAEQQKLRKGNPASDGKKPASRAAFISTQMQRSFNPLSNCEKLLVVKINVARRELSVDLRLRCADLLRLSTSSKM